MNFLDRYILEENIEDMVLENIDFTDIGLGIILGNIGKVQFSPEFLKNLCNDCKLNPVIKVVFLKNILQKLFELIVNSSNNNKFIVQGLIQQFNDLTNLLIELFEYTGEFEGLITSTYAELFGIILRKFSVYDDLVSVPINAYKLKNNLNLKSSFYFLSLEDLQLLQKNSYESPQLMFNLLSRSCEIVSIHSLKPSDELSIKTFNSFYAFFNHLLDNDIPFEFKKIIGVLILYNNNFTYKQRARFREFYNKLRELNIIYSENLEFIKIFSLEPDYQARKISQESNPYKNCSLHPAPKPINRLNYNKPKYDQAQNYKNIDIKRTKQESDMDIDKSVKTELSCLISSLKYYMKDQEIDEEILERNIRDLMNVSFVSLHYNLSNFSYFEQDFSQCSISAWNSILRAVRKIENYPTLDLKQLEYYIEYLNQRN